MASRSRSSKGVGARERSPIKAAGGVVWRHGEGGREVLVVHRPKYDDWSLPKGKLEHNETAPSAAIREIAEETGWTVRLGPELRTARYKVDGVPKTVRYWLADPVSAEPFVANDEIDEIAWIGSAEANRRLRPVDHALVSAVRNAAPAAPLVVVRHAVSVRRKDWKGDDRDRPLNRDGAEHAGRIADLLPAWAPVRVLTSPAKRCRDTVAPFAERAGLSLEFEESLSEEVFEQHHSPVRGLLAELRAGGEPVVLCTHRPLLATIARAIGLDLPKSARPNPLPKGSIWVAHPGSSAAVERYST